MSSSEKYGLIVSIFFGEPTFDDRFIKLCDVNDVINKLELLLDQNIIELENIYQYLHIQKFALHESHHNKILWELIVMVKDFITEEDVRHILKIQKTQNDRQRVFDTFGYMMSNIPIEEMSIDQYVKLHTEDQLIVWLDEQTIETIARWWSTHDAEDNTFLKRYVLNRIDEITSIRNMCVISALICLVGPHKLIDEQIESNIFSYKCDVLSHVIGTTYNENYLNSAVGDNYIRSVYERIVGETQYNQDRYAMYCDVCQHIFVYRGRKCYDGKVVIYGLFYQLEKNNLSEDLLTEFELLHERLGSIIDLFNNTLIPTFFEDTALVEEQVDKFEKLTADIRDFMHRIIDI